MSAGMEPAGAAIRRLVAALLVAWALALGASAAHAQTAGLPPGEKAAEPTAEELRALVGTLEDDAERAKLVAQLKALIAVKEGIEPAVAERPGAALLDRVSARIGAVGQEITDAFQGLGGWQDVARWLAREAGDPARRDVWLNASGAVLLVAVSALLASWLLAWALRRPQRALGHRTPATYLGRLPLVVAELVLDALPIAAFAVTAYLTLTLLDPIAEARIVALALLNASIGVRIVMALARAVLQPLAPGLRLVPMGDENAGYTDVWVRRLALVAVYGYLGCQALLLLGMSPVGYDLLLRMVGLVILVLLAVLVLQNRHAVARFIHRDADRAGRAPAMQSLLHRMADVWHVVALLLLVASYCIWAFDVQGGLDFLVQGAVSTVAILLVARGASMLVRRGAERLLGIGADLARRMPLLEVRANRYLSVVFWALQTVLWGLALLAILQAWQIDSFAWFSTDAGRDVLGRALAIAAILVVAVIVWEIANGLIVRYLSARGRDGQAVVRSARVRTLLPLARNTLLIVICAAALFGTLGELGLNIAPLLAGAGVVGLAVGFGAQTLVRDVIGGVFILFEDQIAVGDVVEVAGKSGVVEAMTIRSITLRDLYGNLHIMPFSAVSTVTNMTRDFAYAVVDVPLGVREDVDAATAAIRKAEADLKADPELARALTAPLEVLGIERIADTGVVVRVRLRTRPGQQWGVGRAFNRAIKHRFDQEGIAMPAQPWAAQPGQPLVAPVLPATPAPERTAGEPA